MSKKDIGYITVIVILIIIIFLLIFTTKFGKIQNNKLEPTGNVDVFDIDIDCITQESEDKNIESGDNSTKKTNNKKCTYTDSKGIKRSIPSNNNSSNNSKDVDEFEGTVYVDDEQGNYSYQSNLKIFNNAAFNYTNKIAPGSYNTYDFEIHNSSNMNLKYVINFIEESEYDINIKYRIRKNGKYIVGNNNTYVSFDEINFPTGTINSNSKDKYSLDWKWFDDDEKDTIAGENMTEDYKLKLNISFEQV